MFKKLLTITLFTVMLLSVSGCKDNKDNKVTTVDVTKEPVAEERADKTPESEDIKNTEVIRVTPAPEEGKIESKKTEENFLGIWRMVSTSSENSNFESMLVDIGYDGYSVSMTFLKSEMNTSYEGKYEIQDGVLVFDKSFEGCRAYFNEGDDETLVVDNGVSQVFCKKVEEN